MAAEVYQVCVYEKIREIPAEILRRVKKTGMRVPAGTCVPVFLQSAKEEQAA